jgi:predicted nucleotidyltransferase
MVNGNSDPELVQYFIDFLKGELRDYGLLEIYLVGSRAKGTNSATSDHDFLAILSDTAPQGILTGRALNEEFIFKLIKKSKIWKRGPVDALLYRKSDFENDSKLTGTFASRLKAERIRVWP